MPEDNIRALRHHIRGGFWAYKLVGIHSLCERTVKEYQHLAKQDESKDFHVWAFNV